MGFNFLLLGWNSLKPGINTRQGGNRSGLVNDGTEQNELGSIYLHSISVACIEDDINI